MDDVSRHDPHELALDLRLPNGSSIETIRQLRKRFPETEAFVMTMEESPLFARKAIDAGATELGVDPCSVGSRRCAGTGEARARSQR